MTDFEYAIRNHFEPIERYTFICKTEDSEITTKVTVPCCHEVVRNFYHFMLGSGYASQTVLDSFFAIQEEYGTKQTE